ncbi:MAG: thioredoxin family protein [Flavobacteriia bacterium]|jgi:thioredoxin-related protein|nr:thioredoxin family protein [Flavobacteriia bacterium]NBX38612.1 thioredoxin family protein [Flavobacteriia bacterium]
MKALLLSLVLTCASFFTIAQKETTTLTWYNDVSLAAEAASTQSKPMLLFFTGSDWCGWCHRLQREVFNTPAFYTWASTNVILVELDFPKNKVQPQNIKDQNQLLQQQFQVQGYPTIWFVNVTKEDEKYNMKSLSSSGYMAGGPDVWIANAKSIIAGGK